MIQGNIWGLGQYRAVFRRLPLKCSTDSVLSPPMHALTSLAFAMARVQKHHSCKRARHRECKYMTSVTLLYTTEWLGWDLSSGCLVLEPMVLHAEPAAFLERRADDDIDRNWIMSLLPRGVTIYHWSLLHFVKSNDSSL